MDNIRSFQDLVAHLSGLGSKKRVAVVWAADDSTQHACLRALESGIIEATFVGCREAIESNAEFDAVRAFVSIVDAADPDDAAAKTVALVREGKADILMKGLINTDNLLRAVLNKETGILPKGNVLTHVTTAQIPGYDHLLLFTDAAVIPHPNREQRIEQVKYVVKMLRSMGVAQPKISLIHCTEKVNEKHFPYTVEYVELIEMAKNGEFGDCIIDGPLDLKTSCCFESLQKKGINSPLKGEADAVIFPDIVAGNVFYKTITLFAGAETAGLLQGAAAPVVIASRGDSTTSKFYSLAVAAIL